MIDTELAAAVVRELQKSQIQLVYPPDLKFIVHSTEPPFQHKNLLTVSAPNKRWPKIGGSICHAVVLFTTESVKISTRERIPAPYQIPTVELYYNDPETTLDKILRLTDKAIKHSLAFSRTRRST